MFIPFDAEVRGDLGRWASSDAFLASVNRLVDAESAAFGVVSRAEPSIDEFIATSGIDPSELADWCRVQRNGSSTVEAAVRTQMPMTFTSVNGKVSHSLLLARSVSQHDDRCWLLMLGRGSAQFYSRDENLADLLLRQLVIEIDGRREPGSGSLIVGRDLRLIHADPYSHVLLVKQPGYFEGLVSVFRKVVVQRWPDLDDSNWHDFAIDLEGRATWVCFRRRSMSPDLYHWHIELRPLDKDELPTVDVLDDDRVARALAYIHDAHGTAPSLADVSASVGVSPFHFHRLFSQGVGVSPKQYLQSKQLQMARWMLRATEASIGDIAQRTGFSSHGQFTATFQRVTGSSPTAYRVKNQCEDFELSA